MASPDSSRDDRGACGPADDADRSSLRLSGGGWCGLLILLLFIVDTAIGIAGSNFHGSLPLPASVLHLIHFVVSFLLLTAVFTLVYKSLPDAYAAWGDAGVGAIATALLFDVGSLVLSLVVAQVAASPYGTAASVLALLAWVDHSAQVFFFGAELTRIPATTTAAGSCRLTAR